MSESLTESDAKKKITLLGAVVNLVLSVLKIGIGWLGQSHALIADGFHSLSDLLSDGLVYYAAHHGSQSADEEHPYGHARFETLATVVLGALLIAVAGGIVWDSVSRLFDDRVVSYGWLVIGAAAISVLAKEVMFQLTMVVAKKTKSDLLRANAWHHRSDAISSLIVLLGVGLQLAGFQYFDSIAALLVGLMVAKIGFDLVLDASKELVDTALDAEVVERIKGVILQAEGVRALHFLRTRKMGEMALIDVHIIVNPMISVSEGHRIGETVRLSILDEVENIAEVMVHTDPEDDEEFSPSVALPLRAELLLSFDEAWQELSHKDAVKQVNLHYLGGKIAVEIILPIGLFSNIQQATSLADGFSEKTLAVKSVTKVVVLFS
ncbi:cation-efflux pump [Cycloclasticus sp. 46_83_sub15_T18]|nr:cation-efflux pump [Cycloclasticus sp. 46_83_sub15_T18]